MENHRTLYWTIVPKNTPTVIRNCNKCKKKKEFYCSELFRINAQQHYLDIWLIYKCSHCESTWNMTILSRVSPKGIKKDLYENFLKNDKDTAWEYAFNLNVLQQNKAVVDYNSVEYLIDGENSLEDIDLADKIVTIVIQSKFFFDLRLDKVLKDKLVISRERLYQLCENNIICFSRNVNINKQKINGNIDFSFHIRDAKNYFTK
jgi:hypothetical protein